MEEKINILHKFDEVKKRRRLIKFLAKVDNSINYVYESMEMLNQNNPKQKRICNRLRAVHIQLNSIYKDVQEVK